MEMKHGFAPIYDENSKVLILGSAPSEKSLEGKFYYEHRSNQFWKLLADVTGAPVPLTIEEKTDFLHGHHIALWDVYKDFEREGSADSQFKKTITNSAEEVIFMIEHSGIRRICTNGGEAYRVFGKVFLPEIERHFGQGSIEVARLVSSSGLAAKPYAEKLEGWRQAVGTALDPAEDIV